MRMKGLRRKWELDGEAKDLAIGSEKAKDTKAKEIAVRS